MRFPRTGIGVNVADSATARGQAHGSTNPQGIFLRGVKKEDVRVGDTIKVRCQLLRDGGKGCLLGFVTPMHGDKARGHGGIERD